MAPQKSRSICMSVGPDFWWRAKLSSSMMETYSMETGSSSQATFCGGGNPGVAPPIMGDVKTEDATEEERRVRRIIRNFTPS